MINFIGKRANSSTWDQHFISFATLNLKLPLIIQYKSKLFLFFPYVYTIFFSENIVNLWQLDKSNYRFFRYMHSK